MHDQLIDVVADVHAVDWAAAGLGAVLPGTTLRGRGRALDRLRRVVLRGRPVAGAGAGARLVRSPPARPNAHAVLLWGDVRLGNLVFDAERRVTAVLDWDLASLGPREMDLGWHFGLEFMMEALFGGRPPGFPGPGEALERYRAAHRLRGAGPGLARGVRAGACARHQRPPPAHHRGPAPAREPHGGHPAGPPGGRRPARGGGSDAEAQVGASSSEKPMTPALSHLVTERVVGLDQAVGHLAVARDPAVVLVLPGQPAAHPGVVHVERLAVDDDLVAAWRPACRARCRRRACRRSGRRTCRSGGRRSGCPGARRSSS